jgi:DNA invertase Pin-like site-specific DNA recombinase
MNKTEHYNVIIEDYIHHHENNMTVDEVAAKYDITRQRLYQILNKNNIKRVGITPLNIEEVRTLRKSGKTLDEIGKIFGVNYLRIREICIDIPKPASKHVHPDSDRIMEYYIKYGSYTLAARKMNSEAGHHVVYPSTIQKVVLRMRSTMIKERNV